MPTRDPAKARTPGRTKGWSKNQIGSKNNINNSFPSFSPYQNGTLMADFVGTTTTLSAQVHETLLRIHHLAKGMRPGKDKN